MELNEYQKHAERTANKKHDSLSNYALGLTGEAGEVADIVKKHLHHEHPLDSEALLGELGDVLFYLANMARINGYTLEAVADYNINKLKERYPDGFSAERSLNR